MSDFLREFKRKILPKIGRPICALFIVAVVVPAYYYKNGIYFNPLFLFCLMMCFAEIWVVAMWKPYQIWPTACEPHGVWQSELAILFFAAVFCVFLRREEIAFVLIACSLSDTGAFICGKLFGKHKAKLVNGISPNKTVEGYIGAFFTPFLTIIPAIYLLKMSITSAIVVYLLISGLAAAIGDLLGSATKRQLMVKDSADELKTLPVFNVLEFPLTLKKPLEGMGGYLDRLDSISLGLLLFAIIVPRH